MKKTIALVLTLFLSLFLTSCGLTVLDEGADSKITRNIGQEYIPTDADRGPVMMNGDLDTETLPAQPTKIATQAPALKTKAYGSSGSITLPHYYQETSYWCGPGSAQMVQYYFNMGCSQSRIAGACGTTTSGTSIWAIANWFNDAPMTGYKVLPTWWKWEVEYLDSYQEFLDCMGFSFYNYKAPQIWNVKTYPSSTYKLPGYTFNGGHFVAGKGYDSTYAKYNDPWYGSGGGPNRSVGKYTMYYCIRANKGLIIY